MLKFRRPHGSEVSSHDRHIQVVFVRSFESASHHILYYNMLCLKYKKMFAHLFCASNQIVFLSGRLVIVNDMMHELQGFARLLVR